jgi:hypothetical protein
MQSGSEQSQESSKSHTTDYRKEKIPMNSSVTGLYNVVLLGRSKREIGRSATSLWMSSQHEHMLNVESKWIV